MPLSSAQLQSLVRRRASHLPAAPVRPARSLPAGVVVELTGLPEAGKTTAALRYVAHTQKLGGRAAFIDSDGRFDREYAHTLGVDCPALTLVAPRPGEELVDIAVTLAASEALSLVVVDSVASLKPSGGDDDEVHVRLVARACGRLRDMAQATSTTVLLCHPLTEGPDGSPLPHPAGRAVRFYAALRLAAEDVLTNGWSLPDSV